MLWHGGDWIADAGRYAVVPVMLMVSLIFALVDRGWRGRNWGRSPAGWESQWSLVILAPPSSRCRPGTCSARGTPPWSASMDRAERTCSATPGAAAVFDISPPGFAFQLSCSTVLASSDADPRR